MMVPKINGLSEINNTTTITSASNASPATPIPTTTSSSKGHGPMTPRTLFSKRESGGGSFIIQDKDYLYILCRGCKTCCNKYQHYMTIKKHTNKKKKFFSF